jgi:hypothetical protein
MSYELRVMSGCHRTILHNAQLLALNSIKMNRIILKALFLSSLFYATACGEDKNDDRLQTQDINRDGAIETVVSTEHLPTNEDVLITTHRIWKSGQIVGERIHRDTIPGLSTGSIEAANAQGDATTTIGQKDYEFYITVK